MSPCGYDGWIEFIIFIGTICVMLRSFCVMLFVVYNTNVYLRLKQAR